MNLTVAAQASEIEIRRLMDGWLAAVRAQDVDAILRHYDPDIVAFDAIRQLRFQGAEAYGRHWAACLAVCPGPMIFDIHDLVIAAGEEVGFGYYLLRCGAVDEQGEEKTSWMRASVGYRCTEKGWRIVHEHFSVPFDMASGKALFDLQP